MRVIYESNRPPYAGSDEQEQPFPKEAKQKILYSAHPFKVSFHRFPRGNLQNFRFGQEASRATCW